MVIQQDMMARQVVFGEINAPLEDVGIHGAGGTFVLAGDNLHPVAAAESVVETHALERMGLAGTGTRNACHKVAELLTTSTDQTDALVRYRHGLEEITGLEKRTGANRNGLQIRYGIALVYSPNLGTKP